MTTGLTYRVIEKDVCSLGEFVLRCARQMAPCGYQRDEDSGVPPRLPSRDELDRLREEVALRETSLASVRAMTVEECGEAIRKTRKRLVEMNEQFAQSTAHNHGRFQAMLVQVIEWQPPTPHHENLKALMLSQLRESDEGADVSPYEIAAVPDITSWHKAEIERCEERLVDAQRDLERAAASFAMRTEWITALYKSIGVNDPAVFFAEWQRRAHARGDTPNLTEVLRDWQRRSK